MVIARPIPRRRAPRPRRQRWGLWVLLAAPVLLVAAVVVAAASGALRGPVQTILENKLGRPVALGSLHIHLLSGMPSATLKGLRIANAPWAGGAPLAEVDRMKVAVNLRDLLRGQVVIGDLEIGHGQFDLRRTADGRANWSTDGGAAGGGLPVIQRLVVGEARIRYEDKARKLAFNGALRSQDDETNGGDKAFRLEGKGLLNQQPMEVAVTGGSVLNRDTGKPYPFSAVASHGRTRLTAEGTFERAFDLSRWQAKASVSGPNMADLYALTGVVFPLTKPYKLSGTLRREGKVFTFNDFNGTVGGSDLAGVMKVTSGGPRLMFEADLHSKLLDPADAGVIFGGGESDGKRLLPDVKLNVNRLRAMDAEVDYKAAAINVNTLPLKQVALHLSLDDGKLVLKPLTVTLPQGQVSGTLVVNAREDVPHVAMDVTLSGAKLEELVPKDALEGPLLARVKLEGRGDSVHAAAAHANGRALVVVPGGQIRQAFAELMGVNVAKGLGLLLTGSEQQTPLRCAVAHFEAQDGELTARHVVFDTGVVKATGQGHVDLNNEALDLRLQGQTKVPRLLHVMAPVTVTGTLLEPKVGVDVAGAATQAGVATVLGVALTPLAAILPFVDPGLADKADCTGLMARAEQHGVPLPKK